MNSNKNKYINFALRNDWHFCNEVRYHFLGCSSGNWCCCQIIQQTISKYVGIVIEACLGNDWIFVGTPSILFKFNTSQDWQILINPTFNINEIKLNFLMRFYLVFTISSYCRRLCQGYLDSLKNKNIVALWNKYYTSLCANDIFLFVYYVHAAVYATDILKILL